MEFRYEHTETILKTLKAEDLPIYTKWKDWHWRVRNVDGKIRCDLLRTDDMSFQASSLNQCLNVDHKRVDEDVWQNAMHKFMNHLK